MAPNILLCRTANLYFAIPTHAIDKVLLAENILSVPGAPRNILGILGRVGGFITVIDLQRSLSKEYIPASPINYVVTVQATNVLYGLGIEDIVCLCNQEDMTKHVSTEYLIADQAIVNIDIQRLENSYWGEPK